MGLFKPSEAALRQRKQELDKKLEQAVRYNWHQSSTVAGLLKKGADPNSRSHRHALLSIVTREIEHSHRTAVIALLVSHGADVNREDNTYGLPIFNAAKRGSTHVLQLLLQSGADVQKRDYLNNTTALCAAADESEWDSCRLLVSWGGLSTADADVRNDFLLKTVNHAAPLDIVRAALTGGADINAAGRYGRSALHAAVLAGQKGYVDLLLAQAGVKIDKPDSSGRTPFYHAVSRDDVETAEKLLERGARADIADNEGNHVLVRAAETGSVVLFKAIVRAHEQRRGNIAKLPLDKALMAAAQHGHGRIVELAVEMGASVDVADAASEGRTPLMKAVIENRVEMCETLMRLGASLHQADTKGMTARDHAAKNKKMSQKLQELWDARARMQGVTGRTDGQYTKVDDNAIEVRQGSLSTTFNFWTQQVIHRDLDRGGMVVQNFADMQRHEAIVEACDKLRQMGGNPPSVHFIDKKTALIRPAK